MTRRPVVQRRDLSPTKVTLKKEGPLRQDWSRDQMRSLVRDIPFSRRPGLAATPNLVGYLSPRRVFLFRTDHLASQTADPVAMFLWDHGHRRRRAVAAGGR